jgi:hypothetical protein
MASSTVLLKCVITTLKIWVCHDGHGGSPYFLAIIVSPTSSEMFLSHQKYGAEIPASLHRPPLIPRPSLLPQPPSIDDPIEYRGLASGPCTWLSSGWAVRRSINLPSHAWSTRSTSCVDQVCPLVRQGYHQATVSSSYHQPPTLGSPTGTLTVHDSLTLVAQPLAIVSSSAKTLCLGPPNMDTMCLARAVKLSIAPKAVCTNSTFSKFQREIWKQEDFRFCQKNEKKMIFKKIF